MSPKGRPEGEYRSAQREGSPMNPKGRPEGKYRSAQREGSPMSPAAFPLQCVLDVRASLGEGPVWSVLERVLYWVDINAPSLNRFDPASGRNTVMPMPESIGCFALRRAGGFVAALRSGVWLLDHEGKRGQQLAAAPYDTATHRFNDGRCDPQGRFWPGSMNEQVNAPSAALMRLDFDHQLREMVRGVTISNGLAWSPDGRTMYHADTPTQRVDAYDFDRASGAISNRRVFVQFTTAGDRPDGGAVDAEGCYWSALYGGGAVVRIAPDGRLLARHPLAARCPTMCAFGGDDLRTLYVTSASQRLTAEEIRERPHSGSIFSMQVDVPGLPEPYFSG